MGALFFLIIGLCVCPSFGDECPTTVHRKTCANETEIAARANALYASIQKISKISEKMFKMVDEIKKLKATCELNKKLQEVEDAPAGGSYPKDCGDLYNRGNRTSGVHFVFPAGALKPFKVYCELLYEGWNVIMRRFSGNVDFYRDWAAYKAGFGRLTGEHWLGNDLIHLLTTQPRVTFKIRAELTFWKTNMSYYQDCEFFKVAAEVHKYKLAVSNCKGNVDFEGMSHYSQMDFSTFDKDNDKSPDKNCALNFKGGWWYSYCHVTNPTGTYKESCDDHTCMEWKHQPLRALTFKVKAA